MGWFKQDDDFITNAKVGRAVRLAQDADRVFQALLCLHSKFGAGGRIPPSKCDPEGLQFEASATLSHVSTKRIAAAIEACVRVGLLEQDRDALVLAGFDAKHMPECSRCHQPNPEPSHGTCPECRRKKAESRRAKAEQSIRETEGGQAGREGHALPAHGAERNCPSAIGAAGQDRTGQDRTVDSQIARGVPLVLGGGVPVPPVPDEGRARLAASLVDSATTARAVRA